MAKYVPDVNTRRWVVISPTRSSRPDEVKEEASAEAILEDKREKYPQQNGFHFSEKCAFCFGHEDQTPPEIYRWGKHGPQDREWVVRVVPNKYPITDIHEVIIHSPDHILDIQTFSQEQVEVLIRVYKERYNNLRDKGQVLIFNNAGEVSGASLEHPHSQVVVVPKQISLDVLTMEPVENVIEEREHFIAWAPDFSQWPWEVWIANRQWGKGEYQQTTSASYFGEIGDEQISEFAGILQSMIQRLMRKFPSMSYNYYIYPGQEWYLRLIPRLVTRAGFELGTGLNVNIADPAMVAEELRKNGK